MKNVRIDKIGAIEILDSRGNPTVQCTVTMECGATGVAAVPSGASTGQYEAHELRDEDESRYFGKGTKMAVDSIERIIGPELKGEVGGDIFAIDRAMIKMDGTDNKIKLGANAMLAVSMATARAAANAYGISLFKFLGGIQANTLPVPMMNILNGGAHASNNLDIQEFMIMPIGADSFGEGLRKGAEVYHSLNSVLRSKKLSTGVGDEGGFAPDLESHEQALDLILEAVEKAGYCPGKDFTIALDAAASEWAEADGYLLPKSGKKMDRGSLVKYFEELCAKYPICSIEDPLGENDYDGFTQITSKIGNGRMIVGDDLFVTNVKRLRDGIEKKAGNAILVKVNQIGTLSEALQTIAMAKSAGFSNIISHRSGETEDSFIADLAVAVNAGYIKTGAPCRSERVCKYNRLLEIEKEIGIGSRYGLK